MGIQQHCRNLQFVEPPPHINAGYNIASLCRVRSLCNHHYNDDCVLQSSLVCLTLFRESPSKMTKPQVLLILALVFVLTNGQRPRNPFGACRLDSKATAGAEVDAVRSETADSRTTARELEKLKTDALTRASPSTRRAVAAARVRHICWHNIRWRIQRLCFNRVVPWCDPQCRRK